MDVSEIRRILEAVAAGDTSVDTALEGLKKLPFEDLGFANLDQHRNLRTGYPEAVYCAGKTVEQVAQIIERLARSNANVIGSRATSEMYEAVKALVPEAIYYEMARTIAVRRNTEMQNAGTIAVVSAGTSDMPVAEEAAVTAEILGNTVERYYDVGVSGIHRLLSRAESIRAARVVIVVAGMEGALASVVGGLVEKPVIAVPTSIGYGANFGGLAALLSMMNSCATGVGVVNIDNGFGAAYLASNINRL